MTDETEAKPTHAQLPIAVLDEVVRLLLTMPAAQVFDVLTSVRTQAVLVVPENQETP